MTMTPNDRSGNTKEAVPPPEPPKLAVGTKIFVPAESALLMREASSGGKQEAKRYGTIYRLEEGAKGFSLRRAVEGQRARGTVIFAPDNLVEGNILIVEWVYSTRKRYGRNDKDRPCVSALANLVSS